MQLTTSPVALPGCCFICRGAQRESYVDTGVSIDYEGAFYICNLCVNEAAHLMAFISHDEYKDLRKAKEDLEHLNFELIKRVGALEESHRALANAGYKFSDDGAIVRTGGYISEVVEGSELITPGGKEVLGDGESESPEQVHDEGVGELLTVTDDSSESEFKLEL